MVIRLVSSFIVPLLLCSLLAHTVLAQKGTNNKKQGPPPAVVVVSEATSGMIAPQAEYVGTVYYKEISDVAAEVEGSVKTVTFEEGWRVKKGHALVMLDSAILKKKLEAAKANHEQTLMDLERARIEFTRIETLHKEESIAEQIYDNNRFRVSGLEKKALALEAEAERFKVEMDKMTIRAPFFGVVLKKHVQRGEWLATGSPVATIARDSLLDVIVNVPEEVTRHVKTNMSVDVKAGSRNFNGKIIAVIPRGDIATRTFPVKVRVRNKRRSLAEGMEARVRLPKGKAQETVIVPRDAIIPKFGNTVIFAVVESKAVMIPVQVIGYQGLQAGVLGEGLEKGMQVVVKGNERLQPGQDVSISGRPAKERKGN